MPEPKAHDGHVDATRREWGARWATAWPLVAPCLVLLAAWLAAWMVGSVRIEREVTLCLISVVLVVGYYSFAGLTGILSFGHMSFMAVGGYVAALVTIPVALKEVLLPELPEFLAGAALGPLPAAVAAGVCAALFAAVLSLPVGRVSGIAAALSMFAVLLIVHEVATHWDAVTGGQQGLTGVPTNTGSGRALIVALLVVGGVYAFQQSRVGLRLRATRDEEVMARASGIDVVSARRMAFVLSGFIIGIGGFLYVQFIGTAQPNAFFIDITFLTIAMLVVGGQHSLGGAVIGATIYSAFSAIFLRFEEGTNVGPLFVDTAPGLHEVGLAAMLLLVLAFRPSGIMRGKEFAWRRRKGSPVSDST